MKVTWNSASYAQFLEPTFKLKPDLEITLLEDFKSFKEGIFPSIFGKDGPYTAPGAIVASRVYHVHLLLTKQERNSAHNRYNCTSDRALVYTQHVNFQDVYSLLAIFPNNAHQYAKDPQIMASIASYAAEFQALTTP